MKKTSTFEKWKTTSTFWKMEDNQFLLSISRYGNSKLATSVVELKGHEFGNGAEETEKDAEVEKSDCVDEDANNLDKLILSKSKLRSCVNMMKAGEQSPNIQSSLMNMLLMTLLSFD